MCKVQYVHGFILCLIFSNDNHFEEWKVDLGSRRGDVLWMIVFVADVESLQKERNDRYFGNKR